MSEPEPIPIYLKKLVDLRDQAQTLLARNYLNELIDFYTNQMEVVDTRLDGEVAFDYCRAKAPDHPSPPTFKKLPVQKQAAGNQPAQGKLPTSKADMIAFQRPPLKRIKEVLLGINPEEYFRAGKGALPPRIV